FPVPSRPAKPGDSPLRAPRRAALHLQALCRSEIPLSQIPSPHPALARQNRRFASASRQPAPHLRALFLPGASTSAENADEHDPVGSCSSSALVAISAATRSGGRGC